MMSPPLRAVRRNNQQQQQGMTNGNGSPFVVVLTSSASVSSTKDSMPPSASHFDALLTGDDIDDDGDRRHRQLAKWCRGQQSVIARLRQQMGARDQDYKQVLEQNEVLLKRIERAERRCSRSTRTTTTSTQTPTKRQRRTLNGADEPSSSVVRSPRKRQPKAKLKSDKVDTPGFTIVKVLKRKAGRTRGDVESMRSDVMLKRHGKLEKLERQVVRRDKMRQREEHQRQRLLEAEKRRRQYFSAFLQKSDGNDALDTKQGMLDDCSKIKIRVCRRLPKGSRTVEDDAVELQLDDSTC